MTIAPPPLLEVPDDPALPGLAAAQPDAMLEACRRHLTSVPGEDRGAWTRCVPGEAVYQPGRSCRIAYALECGDADRPEMIYARWAPDERDHASATFVDAPEGGFELYRYPRDRRMREIRSMAREDWLRDAAQAWFAEWLGDGALDDDGWRCTPIKYVPESRLVCRLKGRWMSGQGERWVRAYVRITRRDDAREQLDLVQRIERQFDHAACPLSVPHPLGAIPEQRLLATEFIRGRTMLDLVQAGETDIVERVSRALPAIGLLAIPRDNQNRNITAVTPPAMLADLGAISAELRDLCGPLRDWSAREVAPPDRAQVVHGDLHARQIILKGDRLCLVDWDRCTLGDPTQDITNLAAELDALDPVQVHSGSVNGCTLAAACVDAWRQNGGSFNAAAARWWATRAYVLRAWGLLRHLRPGWPGNVRRLLERAAAFDRQEESWLPPDVVR